MEDAIHQENLREMQSKRDKVTPLLLLGAKSSRLLTNKNKIHQSNGDLESVIQFNEKEQVVKVQKVVNTTDRALSKRDLSQEITQSMSVRRSMNAANVYEENKKKFQVKLPPTEMLVYPPPIDSNPRNKSKNAEFLRQSQYLSNHTYGVKTKLQRFNYLQTDDQQQIKKQRLESTDSLNSADPDQYNFNKSVPGSVCTQPSFRAREQSKKCEQTQSLKQINMPILQSKFDAKLIKNSQFGTIKNSYPQKKVQKTISDQGFLNMREKKSSEQLLKLPKIPQLNLNSDSETSGSVSPKRNYKIENIEEKDDKLLFVRKSSQKINKIVINPKFFSIKESHLFKKKNFGMLKLEQLSTSYKNEPNVEKKDEKKMTRQNSFNQKISIRQFAHPKTYNTSPKEDAMTCTMTSPNNNNNFVKQQFLATNFDIHKLCNISNHHFNTMCMDILKRCHENDCTINADGTIQILYAPETYVQIKKYPDSQKLEYTYIGSLNSRNQFHGFGIHVRGFAKCFGEWVDGKLNGQGTFENLIAGETYNGSFVNGKKDGEGVHQCQTMKYVGVFKNDQFLSGQKYDLKNGANSRRVIELKKYDKLKIH